MTSPLELEQKYCAKNYLPLPVVLSRGEGIYLWDTEGRQYMDMMSAYSAVSHGHGHPRLVAALKQQADQLAVCSRAFHTDSLGPFLERACEMTGQAQALPMNTGAEAVETALKAARKWGYKRKGVKADQAQIIICDGNFHGRTITIVGFSSERAYKRGFGPFTPGFVRIPYGDAEALEKVITENTVAFLVEPIQGEAGIVVPPDNYLRRCAEICKRHNVLLICDEIQTGMGRTGKLLASMYDDVIPDGLILGKALGGGLLPVSLFLSRADVMDVFGPGDHGSTFGGNPLACRVGLEALNVIEEEGLVENSAQLGAYFIDQLAQIRSPVIRALRGKGLFIGMEINPGYATARTFCELLMAQGILSKETHESVVRFAPPLIITREQVDMAIERIDQVVKTLEHQGRK